MAFLVGFTTPFKGGPTFFTGTGSSSLVPDIFPIAINGRPYQIDMKSNQFRSGFEPRIRDSVDQSTIPGEAAINPGGLWRRSQVSWHLGAGQEYNDSADALDYRFYASRGLDPWTKGQLSMLNDTKQSLAATGTNLKMVVANNRVYIVDGYTVKYSADPFASSPTWTSITGTPTTVGNIRGMTTNGTDVFVSYPGTSGGNAGIWKITSAGVASQYASGHEIGPLGWVKDNLFAAGSADASPANGNDLYWNPPSSITSDDYEHINGAWQWTSFAGGYSAIYVAGYAGNTSAIYKITLDTTTAAFSEPSVALELPIGELVYTMHDYLGVLLIGTNKGIRYATSDNQGNLTVGKLIPTTGTVKTITTDGRFAWFGWSTYEAGSTGIGRLDLSEFTAPNTPAFASDLMWATSGNEVLSVVSFNGKRVFAVSGVGIIVEDTANKVASATLETGIFTWDIPDRKFVAKFDLRTRPLAGTIGASLAIDNGTYQTLGTMSTVGDTEETFDGKESKLIEGKFKLTFTRSATTTSTGPILTRWTARAYAAPARSKFFVVPILLHKRINIRNRDYFFDVTAERDLIASYIEDARILTYQEGTRAYPVTVEELEWIPLDSRDLEWDWEGTLTVTMRSITD